mgnify:FL=1
MEQDTLYIVGNGFDLAHGLKTKYNDFRNWLEESGFHSFVNRMEALYPDVKNANGEWNDIETALGHFKMKDVIAYDKNYTDCNTAGNVVLPVGNNIKSVTASLSGNLWKWIKSVDLLKTKRMFLLNENALFVSFNYTLTLETVYGIPQDKTWHVHGSISDKTNVLVIGYGVDEKFDNAPNPTAYNLTDDDKRRNMMADMVKRVPLYIDKFHKWSNFSKMKTIKHVKVIGHSCSKVDQAYFEDIANAISADADWTFYYHASKSKKYCAKFAKDVVNLVGSKQCVKVKHDSKLKRVKCGMK